MAAVQPFVDLHLHAEGIRDADLVTLAFFGLRAAVTCAWDAPASRPEERRRHWDELVTVQAARLKAAGIRPLVALGVHPSRIPAQGLGGLLQALPRYFDDPRVIALGELGLQTGSKQEEEVLQAQLELALALRRPAIVHTPEADKLARTRRVLSLLRDSRLPPARVLVDHVTPETFPLVRALGCWAGLTLQPGGLDAQAAAAIVSRHGAEGVVLTSDIGDGPSDLLALPKTAEALKAAGLSDELCQRLLHDGPLSFLGLL